MANRHAKAVRIPDYAPLPAGPEDLARAIFRDADRKREARLAAERKTPETA